MSNQSNIQGNQNIILQDITDSTITISINGETKELLNELAALKKMLQEWNAPNIQYAEKLYNIEQLTEANFGFLTGKKAFNEWLTKSLIEAIESDSAKAKQFLEKAKEYPNWEGVERISSRGKAIIAYSFVGVIGIQLSKLMAIGKEELSENKQRKYISKCLDIARRALDLVGFVLLSRFWDLQKRKQVALSENENKMLVNFFRKSFPPSIMEQVRLLNTLLTIYAKQEWDNPIPELDGFINQLQEGTEFFETCKKLGTLNQQLDKEKYTLLDCYEAEKQLAIFLTHFHFLAAYEMASIKRIGYNEIRNTEPRYLHRYAALGIDNKANVDAEKVNYAPDTAYTNAVLFYKGDHYKESINLFPFVIDYNALTFEHGAKICFYCARAMAEDQLDFIFLEDNSVQKIEFTKTIKADTDFNELMMKEENQKRFNLDTVFLQFQAACECVVGDSVNFDDD